ncbi:hypothetical protein B0A49_04906 [Cryomyces minteri]|uniref:Uncharacterized protein n=1 Tax=Cryomyces minteri TaxID=331657 RepID=A0A4U0XSK1_9PEZI|nr:hypothetical protein B0A49_04906 [Cryomyces minteri]
MAQEMYVTDPTSDHTWQEFLSSLTGELATSAEYGSPVLDPVDFDFDLDFNIMPDFTAPDTAQWTNDASAEDWMPASQQHQAELPDARSAVPHLATAPVQAAQHSTCDDQHPCSQPRSGDAPPVDSLQGPTPSLAHSSMIGSLYELVKTLEHRLHEHEGRIERLLQYIDQLQPWTREIGESFEKLKEDVSVGNAEDGKDNTGGNGGKRRRTE